MKCLQDIVRNEDDRGSEGKKRATEAKVIMRKILSKSFVLKLTGTSDIYQNFGLIANLCQGLDVLPHERFDNVMQAVETFDKMLEYIDHSDCIKLQKEDPKAKCLLPCCLQRVS